MTNWKIKLATGAATATLLAAVIAPATFASTVKINHNGKKSVNKVAVLSVNAVMAQQENNNKVVNMTGVFQNTGNNKSSDNTGKGDVTVKSGNTNSTVSNTTKTGGNTAKITPCGCDEMGDHVVISGNGKKSKNTVLVGDMNMTMVSQTNNTTVVNGTVVSQNTGGNKANDNTGKGDVSVTSGSANSTVTNNVTTGGNSLTL